MPTLDGPLSLHCFKLEYYLVPPLDSSLSCLHTRYTRTWAHFVDAEKSLIPIVVLSDHWLSKDELASPRQWCYIFLRGQII
jgi:hypothetical protein